MRVLLSTATPLVDLVKEERITAGILIHYIFACIRHSLVTINTQIPFRALSFATVSQNTFSPLLLATAS